MTDHNHALALGSLALALARDANLRPNLDGMPGAEILDGVTGPGGWPSLMLARIPRPSGTVWVVARTNWRDPEGADLTTVEVHPTEYTGRAALGDEAWGLVMAKRHLPAAHANQAQLRALVERCSGDARDGGLVSPAWTEEIWMNGRVERVPQRLVLSAAWLDSQTDVEAIQERLDAWLSYAYTARTHYRAVLNEYERSIERYRATIQAAQGAVLDIFTDLAEDEVERAEAVTQTLADIQASCEWAERLTRVPSAHPGKLRAESQAWWSQASVKNPFPVSNRVTNQDSYR